MSEEQFNKLMREHKLTQFLVRLWMISAMVLIVAAFVLAVHK